VARDGRALTGRGRQGAKGSGALARALYGQDGEKGHSWRQRRERWPSSGKVGSARPGAKRGARKGCRRGGGRLCGLQRSGVGRPVLSSHLQYRKGPRRRGHCRKQDAATPRSVAALTLLARPASLGQQGSAVGNRLGEGDGGREVHKRLDIEDGGELWGEGRARAHRVRPCLRGARCGCMHTTCVQHSQPRAHARPVAAAAPLRLLQS
jgi:hypothetical protein